jgi:AcrR family transcriptional regulator
MHGIKLANSRPAAQSEGKESRGWVGPPRTKFMQRKNAILFAANHHFARHGFRGASLRDIARDAGVSLTLLNHHFGSKFQLLSAVIDAHRAMLDERVTALLAATAAGPGNFTARDLVQVWIRIGFETAAATDGEMFLRLVARVIDDPSEEAAQVVREKLDDAALIFIDALQQCYPAATRYAAASAYIYVSASLLKFLVSSKRLFRLAQAGAPASPIAEDQERLTRFLVAGIEAALQGQSGVDGFDGADGTAARLVSAATLEDRAKRTPD